ncbi:murein transglycosylase A [Rhizobium sp. TRM96647]|uniref:murein transglycosylase A n=1 Tax=unclassified Rhizobium TaxID=2613769 RepID=UPI0021E91538|nr:MULTISPECIES: murein transglycosylase A [unclassified Rhizobium]MCV3735087.1 murein transglycosylase A [Rhizobium sp. TRM96647]MCV3757457.1 murein transglycosylase A [Rhizobium sp. TRM96650]
MEFRLKPVAFSALPGWTEDDPTAILGAMASCRDHIAEKKPYRTGSLGIAAAELLPALAAAAEAAPEDAGQVRAYFEQWFQPFLIERTDGQQGFVTAYYEPEVEVRAEPDEAFRFPFYRRPDDLVDVDDGNRPPGLDPYFAFARLREGQVEEYPDRKAIEQGLLEGRGLEIAYARSRVDVFFIHVQGAARLLYPDGTIRRITYAAKTGHRFSPIGKLLIERGEIDAATVSMASIRDWLARHPEQVDDVLWHNRSFIFFRDAPVEDLHFGPVAAAKVPIVAGRSLAVDRLIHTFATPFFIRSDSLTHLDGGRPFARTMLALDTGSAIVGSARGDIFTGSGDVAGALAGNVRNAADFYIFVPRSVAARFGHGEG